MAHFLAVQGTYSQLSVGIFQDCALVQQKFFEDVRASSSLVPIVHELLQECGLSLQDLSFIAVDKGPGAFTSLRAVIASINGIAFACGLPLYGVNSLEALELEAMERADASHDAIITVLNAYNNDLYYRIVWSQEGRREGDGCMKAEALTDLIERAERRLVVGNGAGILVPGRQPDFESLVPKLETIARLAWQRWQEGQQGESSIEPYYLKTQLFAIKQ